MTPDPPESIAVRLRVEGWTCLVVGGGRVGSRRARRLAAGGASVRVVDPDADPMLDDEDRVVVERRRYRSSDVEGVRLVVCATGVPEVDTEVAADAAQVGALVNDATAGRSGDLTFPVVGRVGAVTVAIDTGGESPAVARWLVARLDTDLGAPVAELIEIASEARHDLVATSGQTAHPQWETALDDAWAHLSEGRRVEARLALRRQLDL